MIPRSMMLAKLMAMTWYVFYRGRQPGVYNDWASCNNQVSGYRNCSFKSFRTPDVAFASYYAYCNAAIQEQTTSSSSTCKNVLIVSQFMLILILLYKLIF
ncbi:hypothetical protein ACP4OV_014725 [Aristida adscensionis]